MESMTVFARTFSLANQSPETDFWNTPGFLTTPGWDFFTGRYDGEPVATGLGYTSGGVTGIWGIATLPSLRGKGIGSAITRAVVDAGRARGAHATHLWSTELGYPVYRRMGFQHVGNRSVWVSHPAR
jgi:GNAT superfamily N-acetyltransferase